MNKKILVVGIGNPIRQDDGIGPYCAAQMQNDCKWENNKLVDYMVVHQLDVVYGEIFAGYELILFFDADALEGSEAFRLEKIRPQPRHHPFTSHIGSVPDILSLAAEIYGAVPQAFLVAVRGLTFGVGEGLSPVAMSNAEKAVKAAQTLIDELFPLG